MSTHKGYALIAILATAVVGGIMPAFAANEIACPDCIVEQPNQMDLLPISVWTDKAVYDHQSLIVVNGHVRNTNLETDISLKVTGPTGNVVSAGQIMIDDNGDFETTFATSSPLWMQNGVYTISAQYGGESRSDEVKVQLEGEFMGTEVVPEFGPIAALVLAIAIISIIAVSAKTGLRLMPKY